MILVLDGGRSFKGAAAYYLHDKREAGEAERLTTGRVAWTEAVNLPTADPEKAWRMMAHTAMAQAELKAAAGEKATGRKLAKPVSTLLISWKEGDAPDKAEQLAAARALLKVLDVDDRQALIVAHNDTRHQHLHIMINRVSPENGIAAPLSNSQKKLQAWALEYEQARGKIQCPARAEKAEARAKGEAVEPTPRLSRQAHEFRRAAGNDNLTLEFVRTDQRQKDAALAARGRAMHEAHRRQWDALKRTYADNRKRILEYGDRRREGAAAAVKEGYRSEWSELFKRQRREQQQFSFREFTFLGRMKNIGQALRENGWQDGTARQILGAVFNLASGKRIAAFAQKQESERKALARLVKASTAGAVAGVRKQTRDDLDRLRTEYGERSKALTVEQAHDAALLENAWHARNTERRDAFAAMTTRTASKWDAVEAVVKEANERNQGQDFGLGISLNLTPR
jgi:hypothetical protein